MNTPEELNDAMKYADETGINPRIHNPNGTLCPFNDRCRECGLKTVCATYDDVRKHMIKHGSDAQVQFLFGLESQKTCEVIPIGINADNKELAISA